MVRDSGIKPQILVADDENTIRLGFENLLQSNNYDPIIAKDGLEALELFKKHLPPVCIIDFKMPGLNGLELLKEIKKIKENTFVIVITAYSDMEKTIEAMKLGAYDFLKKPFNNDNILMLIKKAYSAYTLVSSNVPEYDEKEVISRASSEFKIIGNSPKMQEVYKLIGKISNSLVTVMITGESGSGKEMVARAIHLNSTRANKQFVAINCSAIPENLIESELFGHEKGSFTGAINRKIGKFELANGGTLFLDEVAEMSLEMQTKFLRVLQEKEIVKVGGNEVIKVDPRIIAATNIDLEKAISEGSLREDLYHRLKVVSIHVPPLRERLEDIDALVKFFIEVYNQEHNKKIVAVSPDVMNFFMEYKWPGNIRELKNVIESAVAICRDNTILFEHLPSEIVEKHKMDSHIASSQAVREISLPAAEGAKLASGSELVKSAEAKAAGLNAGAAAAGKTEDGGEELLAQIRDILQKYVVQKLSAMGTLENVNFYNEIIDSAEKILLEIVLRHFKENQVKTSKFLGINRNTLRSKIEKYNLINLIDK
ncbi:MAG: sigma-54 dependent transcriptional regulator [Candidatus Wallbacteria bacterium]